ncbi:LAMI_0H13784g1_1 [Lachancea mirantina]|uniref:LAMI_0H13784g1_1 n=1 Tax=Lachancea mirantina TaxID=1230905 RepID=A0A1G4KHV2_9SACH|nr:LAMI_0H13784g1_1 [Lachancea mirantina]
MGIKKFFKIKPPEEDTAEVNRETLNELGIPVKNPNKKKKEKFAAYGAFAKDQSKDKFFAPPGYEKFGMADNGDANLEDLNKSDVDAEAQGTGSENAYMAAPKKNEYDPYASHNYGGAMNNANPYQKGSSFSGGAEHSSDPFAKVGYNDTYRSAPAPTQNSFDANMGQSPRYNAYGAAPNLDTSQRGSYDQVRQDDPYSSTSVGRDGQKGPYGNTGQPSRSNPYGSNSSSGSQIESYGNSRQASYQSQSRSSPYNPYDQNNLSNGTPEAHGQTSAKSGQSNPYASYAGSAQDPYSGAGNYGAPSSTRSRGGNPYAASNRKSSQQPDRSAAEAQDLQPQGRPSLDASTLRDDEKFDFETPTRVQTRATALGEDDIDLNAPLQEDGGDDLNEPMHGSYGDELQQLQQQQQFADTSLVPERGFQTFEDVQRENQLRQQQEEDEEVDGIKQEIRFTKQSSVASTRNTLKMAQEAEMAGTNTLGMLGHQSEKLNNVERNLDLMRMQNRVAEDKVAELKKLNRNILAVHVSNPFNSKRRLREAEDRIRMQRIEDKMIEQQTNGRLQQSTQRIEGAMNGVHQEGRNMTQRYQNQGILDRARRYQFENDEEDDEMEVEIDRNLDKIGQVGNRLKKLALATGDEIDAQQTRIKKIENDTDDMDIKIHLNTTRLTHIR